jgi:hypothetical protein
MCQISPIEERIKETDIGSKTFNVGLDDVVIVTDTTSFATSVSHSGILTTDIVVLHMCRSDDVIWTDTEETSVGSDDVIVTDILSRKMAVSAIFFYEI